MREILGDTPFMSRCATTIGQVRDGNDECRTSPWADKCNGGCRAAAIAKSPHFCAPDRNSCLFFRHGWYNRFKAVGQEALDAYLAAHPELVADSGTSGSKDQADDTGPFSNC